jgi:hypothetical protein
MPALFTGILGTGRLINASGASSNHDLSVSAEDHDQLYSASLCVLLNGLEEPITTGQTGGQGGNKGDF